MNILDNVNPKLKDLFLLVFGTLIFVLGINLFIVPIGLYNGGVIGIAQILRTIITDIFKLKVNFEIAGIINFFLNIPLLILAYKGVSKNFFRKTLLAIIIQTILFSIIPISHTQILDEKLASLLTGGILAGLGCGLVLMSGASGGGMDIIGVYTSIKKPGSSVGGLSIIVNFFIYIVCAVLFDIRIAIYSIIYAVIFSLAMDKLHYQNIEVSLVIFTKEKNVKEEIMKKYVRGVTYWNGFGAYTNNQTEVLVTICSKIEVNRIKKDILRVDPKAFIIMSNANVTGGFEKRLA